MVGPIIILPLFTMWAREISLVATHPLVVVPPKCDLEVWSLLKEREIIDETIKNRWNDLT
jgi:hypothetical protein